MLCVSGYGDFDHSTAEMGAYFELCATLLRLRLAVLAPQAAQVSMRCGPTLLRTMRDEQG